MCFILQLFCIFLQQRGKMRHSFIKKFSKLRSVAITSNWNQICTYLTFYKNYKYFCLITSWSQMNTRESESIRIFCHVQQDVWPKKVKSQSWTSLTYFFLLGIILFDLMKKGPNGSLNRTCNKKMFDFCGFCHQMRSFDL